MKFLNFFADMPFHVANYVHRLSFVFSIYCLMIFYGLFANKKPIVPKRYKGGENYMGNLTHNFKNLKNLKNGIKFHYVSNFDNTSHSEKNKLPTFVFLHGIFESWYSWHNQLEQLDKLNIPCIAIDLKNHGNTSAHYSGSVSCEIDLGKNFDLTHQGVEIAELLNELNISNVIFVTTDLGTLICDKLINKFYCPKVAGWIRCHEPMPAYPLDKGLPQKFLFWFNISLSLFLMHNSNEMILRLFYKATGWKPCEAKSATFVKIDDNEIDNCLANAICPYETGHYKGSNANYMSWAGSYAYAFLNDIYTGAVLNVHAYEQCEFPVLLVTGEFDGSCLLSYVDGTTSLGYKLVDGVFYSSMIKTEGENGFSFFVGEEGRNIKIAKSFPATKYFVNSKDCKLVVHKNAGHMTHLECHEKFTQLLEPFYILCSNDNKLK